GAAVGLKHVIGIFIGTGLGGALILDGKLYHGTNGSAGDIGHYLLHTSAPSAGSNTRVLDEVASRTAIGKAASRLASRKLAPYLLIKSVGKDSANNSPTRWRKR